MPETKVYTGKIGKSTTRILARAARPFLLFNCLLIALSALPHWPDIPLSSWVNVSFYFLLFLFSFELFKQDRYNRFLFLNTAVFFLFCSLSFLNIFIGHDFLFGSDYTVFYSFHYKKLLLILILIISTTYIPMKYLLFGLRPLTIYITTLALSFIVFAILFYPYLLNPDYIFELGTSYRADLYQRLLIGHLFSIGVILIYHMLLFKKGFLLGIHISDLSLCFLVFLILELISNLSDIYRFQVFGITQLIVSLNLCFFFLVLLKRLKHINSDFGRFFESLIQNNAEIGEIKVQIPYGKVNTILLAAIKQILYKRRWEILFFTVSLNLILIYLNAAKIILLFFLAVVCLSIIIILTLNKLYSKRASENYILPIRKSIPQIIRDPSNANRQQPRNITNQENSPGDRQVG